MPSATPRAVPGARGLPLVGETLSFLADVKSFIDSRVAQYGSTFRTNLFRTSTVLTCSYHAGAELLLHAHQSQQQQQQQHRSSADLDAGVAYAPFLSPLYPAPNMVLATDGAHERAAQLALLQRCVADAAPFARRASHLISGKVANIVARAAAVEPRPVSITLYATFKPLAAQSINEAVLGEMDARQNARVRRLCADHFNGVAAVPLSLSAFGARSARAAAVDAYHQLIQLFTQLVQARVHALSTEHEHEQQRGDEEEKSAVDVMARLVRRGEAQLSDVVQVLLTLLSPAVAKAVASTATIAVALLAEPSRMALQEQVAVEAADAQYHTLDCVLMETLRMYPPLAGAMRAATRDTQLHGMRVHSGDSVWLSYMHANRDGAAFERAHSFEPARWRDAHAAHGGGERCPFAAVGEDGGRTPLSFGGGRRQCRGRDVAWAVMRRLVGGLLREVTVRGEPMREEDMRYVPVLRPKHDAVVRAWRRRAT